ncbi:MAG: peptidoglycan-associated lipoprotein Pal [Candidatus Krumholzibacteriia bacterium]
MSAGRRVAIGGLLLIALLSALAAGCGRKPKVATETAPAPAPVQVIPESAPPPPAAPAPTPAVDYANLDPNGYGIDDVFFPYDSFTLSEAAMATLERNARLMKEHAAVNYLVEGHCDERGTVEYNLALGEKRARVVQDYLVSLGVPAARLRLVSYGEERPFVEGNDEAAWAQNRRAHFARP